MRREVWVMTAAFVVASGVVGVQTARQVDATRRPSRAAAGMQDFRSTLYYPAIAILAGKNPYEPYDDPDAHPRGRGAPLYLPFNMFVHLPLGLLARHAAESVYFLLALLAALLVAHLALRLCDLPADPAWVLGVASVIVLSRPGQFGLFAGQNTTHAVAGVYAALLYGARRPWLGGLGLAAACLKPTFGLPLAVLMLARREWRAVALGGAAVALLCAASAAILWQLAGGLDPLLDSLGVVARARAARPDVSPVLSPYRVDVASFTGRVLGWPATTATELPVGIGVLGLAALCAWRLAWVGPRVRVFAAGFACNALLVCFYHQAYDAVVLAAPLLALGFDRWRPPGPHPGPEMRWLLLVLLAIPAVNPLNTAPGLLLLGDAGPARTAALALNAAVLLASFAVHVGLAARPEQRDDTSHRLDWGPRDEQREEPEALTP